MPPTEIDEAAARALAGRLPDRTGAGIPGPIRHPNATIFRSATLGFRSGQAERFGDLHIPAMLPENEREKRGRETKSLRAPYPSGGVPHPRATEPEMRPGRDRSVRESGSALRSPRVRKLVRPVSGQYGSAFPGRNAGRTRNICQTRLHTLLHQPFWEVFSAHTFRWLETLWHGAGWKILALGTFGILMHMIGLPNTFPYRNPDKKQGSFL